MKKMWFGVTDTEVVKGISYDVEKWAAPRNAYVTYVSQNMSMDTISKAIESKTNRIEQLRNSAIEYIKTRDVMPALNALRSATKLKSDINELDAKLLMLAMWRDPKKDERTRSRKISTLIAEMRRMRKHAEDALCVDEMLVLAAAHDLGCPFCGHYTKDPIVLKEAPVEEPGVVDTDEFYEEDYDPEEAYDER